MLKLENVTGGYGRAQVLFDISLEVGSGEVVCLLGRNGMGKTTTIRTIMGLMQPWSGDISFEGKSIAGQVASRVARVGLGLVPEGRQIFPNLTVHENLAVAAANRTAASQPWTVARIYDLFPGLAERKNSFGNLLSGGEQQMLAIGRALMTNPKLLILDEATEGLAPVIRTVIWQCLERLRSGGQAILVVDKHVKKLASLGDRFYVVEKGAVAWSGDAAAFVRDADVYARHLSVA
jgi:branched-chain amino acid transport system ATP-binding protein